MASHMALGVSTGVCVLLSLAKAQKQQALWDCRGAGPSEHFYNSCFILFTVGTSIAVP